MRHISYLSLFFALILIAGIVKKPKAQEENWVLEKNEDGIKVYLSEMKNSDFKAIKAEAVFEAAPSSAAAVLLDPASYTEWIFHCIESKLLKRISPFELYYYTETDLPWPTSNRDLIMHCRISRNAKTGVVTSQSVAKPDYLSEKNGIVRIKQAKIKWTFTPVDNGKMQVKYYCRLNPGGMLPAWLVNMTATSGPYETLKNMQNMLQKPVYKNAGVFEK